jgi:CelD/BcsL family acetyltransferase involved in cellulose biosynthesis
MATRPSQMPAAEASPPVGVAMRLELASPAWLAFVRGHSEALAFHLPAWAEAISDCYGFEPFVLAVGDGNGRLLGGLPTIEVRTFRRRRRWVALPFTDLCPPLLSAPLTVDAFTEAIDAARQHAGVSCFDVRAPLAPIEGAALHSDAVIHTVTLGDDPDELFKRFHRSQVQRNIRRAERDGSVTIRVGERPEDLTRVYYDLHLQTRKRHGVPVQPRKFFESLWAHMFETGQGRLLLAYADGAPIAGIVLLVGTETVTYKFGASDASAWRTRPNHLLFWDAIRWAIENGYRDFDLGRSDLDGQGLREFKSGWAGDEQPLIYTTLGGPVADHGAGRGMAAMQAVLRRSPLWACRAAGELLYRYTA